MNCEKFEELLIDFMEGEIDTSERELVRKHLVTCPYCSKKLEEYEEIRRIFNEETLLKPSPQVSARLSKIAREEVRKDKPPFWKKWFYSPIVVPILSSALALFIWVYYGQKNIEHSPDETIYSRNAMAKKAPIAQEPNLSDMGKKIESEKADALSNKPSSISPEKPKEERIMREAELSSEPAPSKGLTAVRKDVQESDKSYDEKSFAGLEAKKEIAKQPTETEEESLERGALVEGRLEEPAEQETQEEKGKKAELYLYQRSDYQNQLDLALKQQKEGNCEASIRINEGLLKASPSPPDSVKEKAYLSLAECYEQKEQWDNAIITYNNLQEVAPKQASFAKERIEDLRQKMNFLKARELRPEDTEKGQMSK